MGRSTSWKPTFTIQTIHQPRFILGFEIIVVDFTVSIMLDLMDRRRSNFCRKISILINILTAFQVSSLRELSLGSLQWKWKIIFQRACSSSQGSSAMTRSYASTAEFLQGEYACPSILCHIRLREAQNFVESQRKVPTHRYWLWLA